MADADLPTIWDEAMKEFRTDFSKIVLERQAEPVSHPVGGQKIPKPERQAETRNMYANPHLMSSLATFYGKRDNVTKDPHPLTGKSAPISRRFVQEMIARTRELNDA